MHAAHDTRVARADAAMTGGFTHGLATATRITSHHLERGGNLACESGDADVTVLRNGVPATHGGRYLTVWHARPDGPGRSSATSS